MKRLLLSACILSIFSCDNKTGTTEKTAESGKRNSLQKISWIEGNWQGRYMGNPFYEIYKIVNDSTLEITSYTWTGSDSTGSTRSSVRWVNNDYYLGDSLNYKVTSITDTSIYMIPVKANNNILWKKKDKDHWDAVLTTRNSEIIYKMERISHFKEQ